MGLLDWVLITCFFLWGLLGAFFFFRTAPYKPRRPAIDPLIQGEIEQSMEWWDREFRKLSGEPEPRAYSWARGVSERLSAVSVTTDDFTYTYPENSARDAWRNYAIQQALNAGDPYRFAEFSAPTTAELNPYPTRVACEEHEYVEDRSFANQYVRIDCINCGYEEENSHWYVEEID